jgi:hypothetical protein
VLELKRRQVRPEIERSIYEVLRTEERGEPAEVGDVVMHELAMRHTDADRHVATPEARARVHVLADAERAERDRDQE